MAFLENIIKKAGVLIGKRRTINLIEGTNITLNVADDPGNDRVNVTINSSGGGGSSPSTFSVTVPYGSMVYSTTIIDLTVTATDKIIISWGNHLSTDENYPNNNILINAIPGTGSFTIELESNNNFSMGGTYKFNYIK